MTKDQLRVAVVGGGIGGVATATVLLRHGIDVHLYEQAPELAEVGAGVAIQPNGARMLERLGLGEELRRYGARWVDQQFRRHDGAYAASMWPPEMAGTIEFYGLHRADLLAMFVDRLPVERIHTGHRCVGFEQAAAAAALTFANGARVEADAVIGADGIHSALQQHVVAPSRPLFSGSVAHRGLITAASVSWPPGQVRNWLGAGKHFLVFPVRANTLVNYVGFVTTQEQSRESWSASGDPAELAREFAGWDPMVEAILAQARNTFRWGLYDREPLATWTNGRLTLLGDAAHPMLPHAGQGANQAIEDAVAVAAILARATRDEVPRALELYESVRRQQAARVQLSSRFNGALYDLAKGDFAERDRQLARQRQSRAYIWNYDAEAEAAAAAASL